VRADRPQAAALPVQVLLQAQVEVPPAVIAAGVPIHRVLQAPAVQVGTLAAVPQVLIQVAILAETRARLTRAAIPAATQEALIQRDQRVRATRAAIPARGHRERTQVGLSPVRIPVQAARNPVRRKVLHGPM